MHTNAIDFLGATLQESDLKSTLKKEVHVLFVTALFAKPWTRILRAGIFTVVWRLLATADSPWLHYWLVKELQHRHK